MSLFGPSAPKGITKKELDYARGELLNGHGAEKLTRQQAEYLTEMLSMSLDADSYAERASGVQQIDASEVAQAEGNIANSRGLQFSETQRAFVHRVLGKYLEKNIVHGLFS